MGKKTKMSFEESLEKLEKCAEELRSGNIDLEKSVELYNQSLEYYNKCKDILASAKQKIEIVNPKTFETEAFDEQ